MTKNVDSQNKENLSESQILEKAKEELTLIKENLIEKKITIDEAKSELKKFNETIQWTNLEEKNKKEIWKASEKFMNLEKNIDETMLKEEFDNFMNLLTSATKGDLADLKKKINNNQIENRLPEVQDWIEKSSANLDLTIHNATEDKNPIARKIGERMEYLMA